jgi:hypothetical protein
VTVEPLRECTHVSAAMIIAFTVCGPPRRASSEAMNEHPEERDDDVGAEKEDSEDKDALPGQPADDDAPLGDTDQHSEAQDA